MSKLTNINLGPIKRHIQTLSGSPSAKANACHLLDAIVKEPIFKKVFAVHGNRASHEDMDIAKSYSRLNASMFLCESITKHNKRDEANQLILKASYSYLIEHKSMLYTIVKEANGSSKSFVNVILKNFQAHMN